MHGNKKHFSLGSCCCDRGLPAGQGAKMLLKCDCGCGESNKKMSHMPVQTSAIPTERNGDAKGSLVAARPALPPWHSCHPARCETGGDTSPPPPHKERQILPGVAVALLKLLLQKVKILAWLRKGFCCVRTSLLGMKQDMTVPPARTPGVNYCPTALTPAVTSGCWNLLWDCQMKLRTCCLPPLLLPAPSPWAELLSHVVGIYRAKQRWREILKFWSKTRTRKHWLLGSFPLFGFMFSPCYLSLEDLFSNWCPRQPANAWKGIFWGTAFLAYFLLAICLQGNILRAGAFCVTGYVLLVPIR